MALGSVADVYADVLPNMDEFEPEMRRKLSKVDASTSGKKVGQQYAGGFSKSLKRLAIGAAAAFSAKAIVSGVNGLVRGASDLNETVSKTDAIFGKNSKSLQKWASTAASSMGLSTQAALAGASQFGNFFSQVGLGDKASLKMSKSLVKMSSDLASFNNAQPAEVMQAFQAATRGEYDTLQKFIPTVSAATVETEALRQTHKKSAKDLTAAEKATALYTIAQRDAGKATGDYGKTANYLANINRSNTAAFENLKNTIGKSLLPAYRAFGMALRDNVLPALQDLADKYGPRVGKTMAEMAKRIAPAFAALASGIKAFRTGMTEDEGTKIERLGLALRELLPTISKFFKELKSGQGGDAGASFRSIADSMQKLVPVMQEFAKTMPGLGDALKVTSIGMAFLADHAETLTKMMPLLVGAFIALKGAQALANAAAVVALPTKIAEVIVNRQLVKSNRELIVSRKLQTGAMVQETVAQNVNTVASARGRVATLAAAAANKVAAIGSKVLAIGLKALRVAWMFALGPIGLIIAAIAGFVAILVLAYKKNETFRKIVDTTWKIVRAGAKAMWENYIRPAFQAFGRGLSQLAQWVGDWRTRLTNAWKVTFSALRAGWQNVVKPTFDKLREGINRVKDGFSNAVKGIRSVWAKIQDAARRPVNFVIQEVYNKAIRGMWGKIRSTLGIKGYDLPWVQPVGDGPGMSSHPVHTTTRRRGTGDGLGNVTKFFSGPVGAVKSAMAGPLSKLEDLGGGGIGATMKRIPKLAVSRLGDIVKSWIKSAVGMGAGGSAGMGWRAQWDLVRKAFPGIQLTSALRVGARTATGNKSYHASGRAIDISPSMAAFNWIRSHYGSKTKELIFSPAGGRQIWNGSNHLYTGVTRAMHWDHVHWAMKNGGVIPEPVIGMGRSGRTYSFGEAGPERVLPAGQSVGGVVNHITINMPPGSDGRDVVRAIQQYERRNGKGWRG